MPALDALVNGTHPTGTSLAALSVYVGGVSGQTVTLTAFAACPPGMFCGDASMINALVTFEAGVRQPVYGEAIDVYGYTTPSGFTVTASTLVVPCDYGLGCTL